MNLMFPEPEHLPSLRIKESINFLVPQLILNGLIAPEARIRSGLLIMLRAAVPETAIYKYDNAFARKDDIRSAGQPIFQTITIPFAPECLPQEDFRLGVFATNGAHAAAALSFGQNVRHR